MGKYKQWLHHQEIGRRLRDQISTYEQERARVQQMAPSHPTSLPELENPIVAALLVYTRAGNRLSNIDVVKAAMPKIDPALEQRRPASNTAAAGVAAAPASPNAAVAAGLQARAASMPADPLEQMRELARGGQPAQPGQQAPRPVTPPATPPAAPRANPANPAKPVTPPQGNPPAGGAGKPDSVGGWWQRQRSED
jgi:hypothetical protein